MLFIYPPHIFYCSRGSGLEFEFKTRIGFYIFQPGPYSETKTDLEKNRKLVRWVYKVGKLHLT